jgi:hypothetical protein
MRVDDQNGSSKLGKGRVYQRWKNVLAVSLTIVETLLMISVRTYTRSCKRRSQALGRDPRAIPGRDMHDPESGLSRTHHI